MNDFLEMGFAASDFTPAPRLSLLGQMHERFATHARDPLTANAVAMRQAALTVVLVSVDVALLPDEFVNAVQMDFERVTGLPGRHLLLHSTHTHVAPITVKLIKGDPDPDFMESLKNSILGAASRALARMEPAQLFCGTGHLDHMGWNRRAMFANGTSQMYGNSEQPGFIGMEGPRDPALPMLCARDGAGNVLGVLLNFSTHPNSIEGESVYSADVPGAARAVLRQVLGEEIGIVYFTGAAGNTAPSLLDPLAPDQPWRGEAGLRRSGQYLGAEAAKTMAAAIEPMVSPKLKLLQRIIEVPLRDWPREGEPSYPPSLLGEPQGGRTDYYREAQETWPRYRADNNPWQLRINVLRIGDAALCFNPGELFVEFGLEMRAASPGRITFINQLTDGYAGYIPTPLAFSRGGYETWCAPSSRLAPEAGDAIVAATIELLRAVFVD